MTDKNVYHATRPICPHCNTTIKSIIDGWLGYYKDRDNFKCSNADCGKPFVQMDDGEIRKFDSNTTVKQHSDDYMEQWIIDNRYDD